ncbi:hypothetical protein JCGZ_07883 [Jatropha curcas]|uniref:Uncharacterized protein n=1 Tax=Jatropha curcas TaxID=180498 RepID=A0A067KWM3_JATCU|nr:hypothetical protein JCGZ_07883 [Jatropha curcas]
MHGLGVLKSGSPAGEARGVLGKHPLMSPSGTGVPQSTSRPCLLLSLPPGFVMGLLGLTHPNPIMARPCLLAPPRPCSLLSLP